MPHITPRSIANNAEIDVIWDRLQPAVDAALDALNTAPSGHPTPFKVETGGCKDAKIDFTASGEVKIPSGEMAPAGGLMEWEIPREAPSDWPATAQSALKTFWTDRKSKPSLNAAALVWSKVPKIISAHDTGPLIRSRNGFWLAIPTPAAGKSARGGRITPGEWERRNGLRLRFIYRRRGPSLLVAEGRLNSKRRAVASRSKTGCSVATVPIFLMVPQVKLRKRLDLARDAERVQGALPGLIVANWAEGKSR